jgi:lysine biosynthesis protein LysW
VTQSQSDQDQSEQALFITCPVCADELEVPAEEWAAFDVGDVLVCEDCGAELEIESLDPPEFSLLGLLTECPNCSGEVELSEDELEEGKVITCPHCQAKFEIELEPANETDSESEARDQA